MAKLTKQPKTTPRSELLSLLLTCRSVACNTFHSSSASSQIHV